MANIVYIDDAPADTAMMQSFLRSAGHSMTAYHSSVGVEEKVQAEQPTLILLDIVMPERNGYEVLRALKRQGSTKAVPVILVTSKGEETDVRWGLRQGAAAYVTKPFSESSLLEAITEQLAAPT